eukprot:500726-Pyramimonas_sp.AAC.1
MCPSSPPPERTDAPAPEAWQAPRADPSSTPPAADRHAGPPCLPRTHVAPCQHLPTQLHWWVAL